jgi:hypothetical protein
MWDFIEKFSVLLAIILSVPVVWSWMILLGSKRRQKMLIKTIEKTTGNRPVYVLVDIGKGESENQVLAFLRSQSVSINKIQKISREKITKDDLQYLVNELQKIKGESMEVGVDRFHIFYKGPVAFAMIVGEVFSNTPTTVYQYDTKEGVYESWGPLHRRYNI